MGNKIFLLIIGALFTLSFASAEYGIWGIQDLDIISRAEWGADESWRYESQKVYQDQNKKEKQYEDYLISVRKSDISKYAQLMQAKIEKDKKETTRNQYLSGSFPNQRKLDNIIWSEAGNTLRRANQIKNRKESIIIHHTVDDYTKLADKNAVKEKIRNIYKYHALNKLRGDIGYNFIIDHFGNIYEGKAGGPGVTGAHSSRNNRPSIGISLIGNFEIQNPTEAQLKSLVALSSALAKKYNIDPYGKSTYHKDSNNYPYLTDLNDFKIVGHRDTGTTACPGKNMYSKLPAIRELVNNYILANKSSSEILKEPDFNNKVGLYITSPTVQVSNLPDHIYQKEDSIKYVNLVYNKTTQINGNQTIISIPAKIDGDVVKCSSFNLNYTASNCKYENGNLIVQLNHLKSNASGKSYLRVDTTKNYYKIKVNLIWMNDIQYFIDKAKSNYKKESGFVDSINSSQKITYKNTLSDVRKYLKTNVKVLLYELSTEFDTWEISCKDNCLIILDGIEYTGKSHVTVKKYENKLQVEMDNKKISGKKITVSSEGEIAIVNYTRKSYAGEPWNVFKGKIIIQNDLIKPLNADITSQFVVVNELSVNDYMQGIAEANDQVHYEKIKAMALISKSYLLFYMNKKNYHPSIPQDAYYNSVDDARIFQKYVGNGYTRTVKLWGKALEETKNQVITYDGYVPILPYFNCSKGFTLTGKEKYGWTDTPYLTSKIDFASCDNFNGHGVGLSGQGAQKMAEKGLKYSSIIKYYYNGVKVSKIK
ncbi:MAG: N-acetylmuramoyl-L-alanine amidase [Candidatus Absconditabacteria bacterium]